MKIIQCVLCTFLISTFSLQARSFERDGNWWRSQTGTQKLSYITGIVDGMPVGRSLTQWNSSITNDELNLAFYRDVATLYAENFKKYFAKVTTGQLVDGLNSFYEDYRNRSIPLTDSILFVGGVISVRPEEELNPWLDGLRNGGISDDQETKLQEESIAYTTGKPADLRPSTSIFLETDYEVIRTIDQVPEALFACLGQLCGSSRETFTDPGKPFNSTGAIKSGITARNRLIFAGRASDSLFIAYEHGGPDYHCCLVLFKPIHDRVVTRWLGTFWRPVITLDELRALVKKGDVTRLGGYIVSGNF